MFNKKVKCINNENCKSLKLNYIYTVLLCVYKNSVEFYKLKEINNKIYESWRFEEVPFPGNISGNFLSEMRDWSSQYHANEIVMNS